MLPRFSCPPLVGMRFPREMRSRSFTQIPRCTLVSAPDHVAHNHLKNTVMMDFKASSMPSAPPVRVPVLQDIMFSAPKLMRSFLEVADYGLFFCRCVRQNEGNWLR